MIEVVGFVFGVAIGSFLNVLILRLPKGVSISIPASHCPHCLTPLKWWHNIPLFSWIFLKGTCAFCKMPISWHYPAIETLSGILFAWMAHNYGLSLHALLLALSFALLLALSMIDWRYKAVPDSLNLLVLLFAFLAFFSLEALIDGLLFAGGFALLRIIMSYYVYKKLHFLEKHTCPSPWRSYYDRFGSYEAMGEADIIVAATIGVVLGIHLGLVALFLSALLALPFALWRMKHDKQTPFIPFLAMALWIVFLFQAPLYLFLESLYA